MAKHSKDPAPSPVYVKDLNQVVVPSSIESVQENVRIIDESIKKHPIPPPTVKE